MYPCVCAPTLASSWHLVRVQQGAVHCVICVANIFEQVVAQSLPVRTGRMVLAQPHLLALATVPEKLISFLREQPFQVAKGMVRPFGHGEVHQHRRHTAARVDFK